MTMPSSQTATVALPTDEQILITREFDAPKDLVYRAWTTPGRQALVERQARRGHDLRDRPAGRRRVALRDGDGGRARGRLPRRVPRDVPNERIVSTEAYEGIPDADEHATLNTATLTEVDGRTTLTVLVQAPSKATRDAIVDSGMEAGMQDAMDLLEEVAISLR